MGMLTIMPIGTRVRVKYQDAEENSRGVIIGKITNIFNDLVLPNLNRNNLVVAGVYVEKWIENGKELEIKRYINDKTNIYRKDIISKIN